MFCFYCNGETEDYWGREVKGVGVMKDKELKVEEIETSHTVRRNGSRSCPGEREVECYGT